MLKAIMLSSASRFRSWSVESVDVLMIVICMHTALYVVQSLSPPLRRRRRRNPGSADGTPADSPQLLRFAPKPVERGGGPPNIPPTSALRAWLFKAVGRSIASTIWLSDSHPVGAPARVPLDFSRLRQTTDLQI